MDSSERGTVISLEAAVARRLHRMVAQKATLPTVEAPSTEGLEARVRVPSLTQEELTGRLEALAWELGGRRPFKAGEKAQPGDELEVDVLVLEAGVATGARQGMKLAMIPQAQLPGVVEALQGARVGEMREVRVKLPADYEVAHLRGREVVMRVEVKGAWEVTLPDMRGADFLRKAGRGGTLEQLMESLGRELSREKGQRTQREVEERVLDEVAARLKVELPAGLVEQELRQRWAEGEGEWLGRFNLPAAEQEKALQAWLENAQVRRDAERLVRISLALAAIAKRDALTVSPGKQEQLLEELAQEMGVTGEQVRRAVAGDSRVKQRMEQYVSHRVAVEHVMGLVQVHLLESP